MYLFADLFIARLSYPIETLINVTYQGSTAPEAMETQDIQHQRRWKPRIDSTRGDKNPGSTPPKTMETQGPLEFL
jgi:hypothetical protein